MCKDNVRCGGVRGEKMEIGGFEEEGWIHVRKKIVRSVWGEWVFSGRFIREEES